MNRKFLALIICAFSIISFFVAYFTFSLLFQKISAKTLSFDECEKMFSKEISETALKKLCACMMENKERFFLRSSLKENCVHAIPVLFTKEEIISLADKAREARKFLELYPKANISADISGSWMMEHAFDAHAAVKYEIELCEGKKETSACLLSLYIFINLLTEKVEGVLINCSGRIVRENITSYLVSRKCEKELGISSSKGFCGISTKGRCFGDEDCIISGCSAQVCQSRFEKPVKTTCEYKECYNATNYAAQCRCVNNTCRWVIGY